MLPKIEGETVAFTGHRPNKLYGYNKNSVGNQKLLAKWRKEMIYFAKNEGVKRFISGMALGTDQWLAEIVLEMRDELGLEVELVCAIPHDEQYKIWNPEDVAVWHSIVERADIVYHVSKEPFSARRLNERNMWMVDNCDWLMSIFNETTGGTYNCIKYAEKMGKDVLYLHPTRLDFHWIYPENVI